VSRKKRPKNPAVNLIVKALRKRHPENAWAFATEIDTITGHPRDHLHYDGPGGTRRIDAFAMALWPSKGYRRVAYEIKTSRADWLAEIHHPEKRAQAYYLSHEFWFALSTGVFREDDLRVTDDGEVDKDLIHNCGIMEIQDDGSIKTIRSCRGRSAWPMPEQFITSLLRRVRDCEWRKDITNWF